MSDPSADLARLRARAASFAALIQALPADAAIREAGRCHPGRIAVLSSFGADAAVLLHLVARADPGIPVLLLETGQLFPETLAYREALVARLGLRDVRSIRPDPAALAARDADGGLHARDPAACCALRKVEPQAVALTGFELLVTGRKRFQAATRAHLPLVEAGADGRLRLNPLARWSAADLATYRLVNELPAHPLEARGFPSIGCRPCTDRVRPGEESRAGRWRGLAKTECGMHPVAA